MVCTAGLCCDSFQPIIIAKATATPDQANALPLNSPRQLSSFHSGFNSLSLSPGILGTKSLSSPLAASRESEPAAKLLPRRGIGRQQLLDASLFVDRQFAVEIGAKQFCNWHVIHTSHFKNEALIPRSTTLLSIGREAAFARGATGCAPSPQAHRVSRRSFHNSSRRSRAVQAPHDVLRPRRR